MPRVLLPPIIMREEIKAQRYRSVGRAKSFEICDDRFVPKHIEEKSLRDAFCKNFGGKK